MAQIPKPIHEAKPATLTSIDAKGREGASAASIVAAALCPALMSCVIPLLIAGALTATALAVALVVAVVAAAALGAASATRARSGMRLAAGIVLACALAAMLAVPGAREGLFAVCNSAISHYDDAFDAYVPLISQTGLVAGDVVFAVCAGLVSAVFAWFAARLRSTGASLLALVALCSVSVRLSLGFGLAGSCVGVASWLMQCRWRQLNGSSYSASTIAMSMSVGVIGCCGIFFACAMLWSPSVAIDEAHDAMRGTVDEVRYGTGSLPEGDLAEAAKMNRGDGELTVAFDKAVSNDVLLRGFVGATYENGAWSALDHNAYEGEWAHMTDWLSSMGTPCATQRAAFDDASAEAGRSAQASTIGVTVDASQTRSRYAYVPYTLRGLSGSSASTSSDGALRTGIVGDGSYRFTMDDVSASVMLADASWLGSSDSPYVSAESVYSAFCHDRYLAISDEDAGAVKRFFFDDATWDGNADVSDYAVISRVRTMMETLASYTTSPKAPASDEPFAEWLFEEARAGNSASFATAAVLAFRSQGIPARYAEGYRASQADIARAVEAGDSLTLTSENAHAWAEVYLDGVGWTPVEVTPGFYAQSLEADSVIDVAEAKSSGANDDVLQSGSVSGQVDDEEEEDAEPSFDLQPGRILLVSAGALAGLLAICALSACVQRKARIRRRAARIASDDQAVSVPALYRYLTAVMRSSVPAFNEKNPLECLGGFAGAFPGIDAREYERTIALYQRYTFGARELKPHEMRTLRRFGERLHNEMPPAKTAAARMRRTFVDAL